MIVWWALIVAVLVAQGHGKNDEEPEEEVKTKDPWIIGAKKGDEFMDGGDLKLTEAQRKKLFGERSAYGASFRYATMWSGAKLPYKFAYNVFWSSEEREIEKAMRVIEQDTCIRFVKRTNEADYVTIQDDNSGCNSYLGDINNGSQPLNLARNGCMQFGTFLHELLHALGMLHEHQNPTRDDFVTYNKKNVDPDNLSQLKRYSNYMSNKHAGYDLSSIMHYELTAFSRDRISKTLDVGNTFWEHHIGRRYSHMLSFGDVKTLNLMYNCGGHCKKRCSGQEYLDKDCNCVSYQAYYAKYCKDDPEQIGWCEKQAKSGSCDPKNDDHMNLCTKTCDFCPKFLPGQKGTKDRPRNHCVDQYTYTEKCQKWAKEGACKDYPVWMERHCRKSCHKYTKSCDKNVGRCANRLPDDDCESYANSWLWDYCGSPKHWGRKARIQCPDSCKQCPNEQGVIVG